MRSLSCTIIVLFFTTLLSAQSPHGSELKQDCALCHSSNSWVVDRSAVQFSHDSTKFPLVGQHNFVNCRECHTSLVFTEAQTDCASCHTDVHNNTVGEDCARCHTPNTWLIDNTTEMHQQSRFPLMGGHRNVSCTACHVSASNLMFEPKGIECIDCHQTDFKQTTDPNHVEGGFSTSCTECHQSDALSWNADEIDHSFFPLTGGHNIGCVECHTTGKLEKIPANCIDCHQDTYNQTEAPKHSDAGIPITCEECHTTASWTPSNFDHATTGFTLTGGHTKIEQCSDCHQGVLTEASPDCFSCHQSQYNSAEDHASRAFPTTCTMCHTTDNWHSANFDHNSTGFPLIGQHRSTECASCHTDGFAGTPRDCNSCHNENFNQARSPGHTAAGIPTNCEECHTPSAWKPSKFDHAGTGFALTGSHLNIEQCSDCHQGTLTAADPACFSCHEAQYNEAPNHVSQSFPMNCTMCHTTQSWDESHFDHSQTNFPLEGQHQTVECASCHTNGFAGTPTDCNSCHAGNFNQAVLPSHTAAGIPTNCEECHTPSAWTPSKFEHASTGFELTGSHLNIQQCSDCHQGTLTAADPACFSCHNENFNQAQSPNHTAAGIPTNCEECHTPSAWKPSKFDHASTGFELTGSHLNIEQCSDCHQGTLTAAAPDCFSCHESQYNGAPNHVSQSFPMNCTMCHTTDNWLETNFDHSQTNFPLEGQHQTVECASCHTDGFAGTPTACNSCHSENFNQAASPSHTAAGIPIACEECHTPSAWKPSKFEHASTGFELTGSHLNIEQCSACHQGSLTDASPDCFSCHESQYNGAPNHISQSFPMNCIMCHSTDNWLETNFDHSKTNFPLEGQHQTVECASCHTDGFAGTPTACNSCHSENFNQATLPSHTAAGIPSSCEDCHTPASWKPSTFDHITTGFELTGGHRLIEQCSDCHEGSLGNTSPECISCHQTQYDYAPDHKQYGYPLECTLCHSTNDWLETNFDHNQTNFPLTGEHISVDCASCHTSGFAGTSTECSSCHLANYQAAQIPSHTAAGLPTTCEDCHNTGGWAPSDFNHSSTGFTLTGSHLDIEQCSDCHQGNVTSASPECISCHQTQYNGAPDHVAQGYPTSCTLCHNTSNWLETNFDHNQTNFPLTGQHSTVECSSCHTSGFAGTATECSSCHLSNYQSAQSPSHTAAGIQTTCEDCHNTGGWTPSDFNHSSTGFTLSGGHAFITQCSECHKGNLTSASQECISCHQTQYNGAPDHVSQGYPTSCTMCHTTNNWLETNFDHNQTNFPLTGAHRTVDCSSCHTNGFSGTSTDCASCHLSDYNNTTNPNHQASGFPTDCASCHNTNTWDGATFNHDAMYFPIYSGHHRGEWSSCATCHTSSSDYSVFTCLVCHEHRQSKMDSEHQGRAGYSYNSEACYSCHPNGRED